MLGLGLFVLGFRLWGYPGYVLMAGSILLVAFVIAFFRDPRRIPPVEAADGSLLLAPADGKVVLIKQVEEQDYIQGSGTQLSIFLSLMDVHVNRVPATGTIERCRYIPGGYLVAWHPKSSKKNERVEFGLRHASGARLVFKVIAGAVARRIVYHIGEGDQVRAGDRFGIVKFGSRMDVIIPEGIEFDVAVGDTVRAGKTIIGRWTDRKKAARESGTPDRNSENAAPTENV